MIDAHLHLHHLPEKSVFAEILRAAPERGVRRFFCNGIKIEDCEVLSEIASEYDSVIPFYGIHPWEAGNVVSGWEETIEKSAAEPLCGIGEIGLDKAKEPDLSKQMPVFIRQLELAAQLKKPVMIHCVRAWGEMMPLLRERAGGVRFLVHSFRGSDEILDEVMKLGGYVTFSWKLFNQKYGIPVEKAEAMARRVPPGRLLLETDFPYIGEKSIATLTAEQYFDCVRNTYENAARALRVPLENLEERVGKNGETFLHGTPDR